MCIAVMEMCHRKGGSSITRDPNWLDEAYGRLYSVPCPLTLAVVVGLANPRRMGSTTYGKSAHLCAEFDQTGILVVLSDMSGLGPLRNSWMWMVTGKLTYENMTH